MILEVVLRGWYTDALQIPVKFRWTPQNPVIVNMIFMDYADNITWEVGREVLANGLFEKVGLFDIKIWPEYDRVCVRLSNGAKDIIVKFEKREVASFIHATFKAVPNGEEYNIDWDEEAKQLLE